MKLVFLLFTFSHLNIFAQLIKLQFNHYIENCIPFNSELIKAENIKSLRLSYFSKPDNGIIIDLKEQNIYQFDSIGNIVKYIVIHKNDSVITSFYYQNNRCLIKRISGNFFYTSFYYEYYDNGAFKKQTKCKEINLGTSDNFILGQQTILFEESYTYLKLSDWQEKKIYLNDIGKAYKEGILYFNDKGQLISEEYQYNIASWLTTKVNYTYDDRGNVVTYSKVENTNGYAENNAYVYKYDDKNNLITEEKYLNDTKTEERSYVLDEQKKRIKSIVTRYYKENRIGIIKLEYDFK